MIQPVVVEVFGEYESGKTEIIYSSEKLGFNPIVFDTTSSGESKANALGVYGESEYKKHWVHIKNLNELRNEVKKLIQGKLDYNVIGIDTSADLQDMAVAEWLGDPKQKEKHREKPMPEEYGIIRDKIDLIIRDIMETEMFHLIVTSKMKRNYAVVRDTDGRPIVDDRKRTVSYFTGKRARDGLDNDRIGFASDLRLRLSLEEIKVDKTVDGKTIGKEDKIQRRLFVFKNRFCSREGSGWIQYFVGDNEVNWGGIVKLVTIPKELGGRGIKEEWLK